MNQKSRTLNVWLVTLLGLACLPLVVGQVKSPATRTPDSVPVAVPSDEAEVIADALALHDLHEYMRQFGDDYVAPLTVGEQIEASGVVDPMLFQKVLERDSYEISWDSMNSTLLVEINGQPPTTLEIEEDQNGKIKWTATVVINKRQTRRLIKLEEKYEGFVLATGNSVVFEFVTAYYTYRFEKPLSVSQPQTATTPLMFDGGNGHCASCGCKGLPPKGACAATGCDKSDDCTTKPSNPATCVWAATQVQCD